jgi:WD40 repeat protein
VWDLARREQVGVLAGHAFRVMGVAITPDGRRAISASGDTTLNMWDLTTPATVQPLAGDAGMVTAIAITPDGRFAVSYTREPAPGTYTVWDLEAAAVVHTSRGHLNHARDGRLTLSAGDGQTLVVRDLQEQTQRVLSLGGWTNRKIIVLPDGQSLRFEDLWTPIVHLVRSAPAERMLAFEGHTSEVYDVAVTPDGKRAITGSDDRTLRVWELDTGKAVCTLRGHSRQVWSVAVAGDGRTIVSVSDDRDLIVWDIERQLLVARFSADGPLTACAIAPDGTTAITGDEAGRMHILRLERRES